MYITQFSWLNYNKLEGCVHKIHVSFIRPLFSQHTCNFKKKKRRDNMKYERNTRSSSIKHDCLIIFPKSLSAQVGKYQSFLSAST